MSSSSPVEVESDPYSVAQTIALMALGRRAKSRGELFTLLKKRGIEEEVANAVLFRLRNKALSMTMNSLATGVSLANALRKFQSGSSQVNFVQRESQTRSLNGSLAISLMNLNLLTRCNLQNVNLAPSEALRLKLPTEGCMGRSRAVVSPGTS